MKFRVPNRLSYVATEKFLDSLPAEFEIVPEGHVCVKWPEGVTKDSLTIAAQAVMYQDKHPQHELSGMLCRLAAIAPEKKKQRVSLWEAGGRLHVWGEHDTAGYPWRKRAGPIELDD